MQLTAEQLHFFETFGYIQFPQLLADSIEWIIAEFEGIFERRAYMGHNGTQRTCLVPFIDQSERLCTLLDDQRIVGITSSLLGPEFNYVGGDGNYYVGDTGWHSDGWHTDVKYIKIALYLDAVRRDTGCLRVIPGSHRTQDSFAQQLADVQRSKEKFNLASSEIPAIALESNPGDVVVFNHNIKHAAFGGSNRRRMFTLNLCEHCASEEALADLEGFITGHSRFLLDHLHSDVMWDTASPERMRHLQQVRLYESRMQAHSAELRATGAESSRG